MCLVLTVQAPESARDSLKALAQALPPDALRLELDRPCRWFRRKPVLVSGAVSESGVCACSLLAGDADWNAPFWSMRPEVLPSLARTLEAVAKTVSEGLRVQALWIGDPPLEEREVALEDLLAIVLSGRLGTRTRYLVSPRRVSAPSVQLR